MSTATPPNSPPVDRPQIVELITYAAMEQARYEHRGNYGQRTYDDVYQAVYGADTMAEYL